MEKSGDGLMGKKKVYRVIENDEIVGVFSRQEYAKDFVDYQATISEKKFEIRSVDLEEWLLEPREF